MNLLTAHLDFLWLTVMIKTPKQFVARPPVVSNPYEIKQGQSNQSIFDKIFLDYKTAFAGLSFFWIKTLNKSRPVITENPVTSFSDCEPGWFFDGFDSCLKSRE